MKSNNLKKAIKSGIALFILVIITITANAQSDKTKTKQTKKKNTKSTMKNENDSLSYALGVSIGNNLKQAGVSTLNTEVLATAMKSALEGGTIEMNEQQANVIIQEQLSKLAEEKASLAKKDGENFLLNNKTQQGIKSTESGLQYKIVLEGSGIQPDANDKVTVHYHGTLTDGTVFDSSVKRGEPITFGLNQVIPGWTEGLQLMKEGGKSILYIPQDLGYGAQDMGTIPPYSTLIFEVELIAVEKVD
jgi:FKBP-type peptidyl-prolyl cis-trans isomerase FklB